MTIDDRYLRLLNRRAPSDERYIHRLAESFEAETGTTTKYLLGAMKPVESKYTAKLVEQGDRVENQLSKRLSASYPSIVFRRQGSVSNLTHIRFYSDVDVLVVIDKFVTLETPLRAAVLYQGNPEDDLDELRMRCFQGVSAAFPAVEIDDTGSTAVKMHKSGSLVCSVDVVPANWYDTVAYTQSKDERDRSIQVLDRTKHTRRKNSPFLFNHRLHEHDIRFDGIPRMLIRLLKTVKADLEEDGETEVQFSSFDICSIVYRFHRGASDLLGAPLDLIGNELKWMLPVACNASLREHAKVVDDSRDIFDTSEKATGFGRLAAELLRLYKDAANEHGTMFLTASHRS